MFSAHQTEMSKLAQELESVRAQLDQMIRLQEKQLHLKKDHGFDKMVKTSKTAKDTKFKVGQLDLKSKSHFEDTDPTLPKSNSQSSKHIQSQERE